LDDGLLADGEHWASSWKRIFALRETERMAAKTEVTAFKALMRGNRQECLLTGLFELIEPGAWDPPPCGRCPNCRAQKVVPPAKLSPPLDLEMWPRCTPSDTLPVGVMLVSPDDADFDGGLPRLVERLVAVGVDQFIAPTEVVDALTRLIAASDAQFGLVHDQSSWLANPSALSDLPTALLLGRNAPDVDLILRRVSEATDARPELAVVLVADHTRKVQQRPLSQVASQIAAYEEHALDAMCMQRRTAEMMATNP
jgi:hypothetical protein